MEMTEENYLAHYGILRKSGRYPWGSGGDENTRHRDLLDYVENMRKQGLTESQIAKGMDINTTQLRALKSIAIAQKKQEDIATVARLKGKGMSNVAIGTQMGINESSVRSLLTDSENRKVDVIQATATMLRDQVAAKTYVDIGDGVENYVGVTKNKLATAVAVLQDEGYNKYYLKVRQLGTGKETTLKVLAGPETTYSELSKNRGSIRQINEQSDDGGASYSALQPPMQVSSKRVGIAYKEDGGADADGVIYVRRGVDDVTLGSSRYAQVRVAVDGTHYLKGMAVYSDKMPEGVDLLFHTNKSDTGNKLDAMKKLTDDDELPFGAVVRQLKKLDENGQEIPNTVRSAMNIVNEEGRWDSWSRSLSSQMLSKQSIALAKSQLEMTQERRTNQLDEILAMTNPTVRKKLLESYADATDSAAVHLKAAALPRQASRVILPIQSLKDNEVYAPGYRDGEKVVLVRYPHGGPFEIPELTVNNRNSQGRSIIGNTARDAIGINPHVANRLSGADFDGDAVLVIPNNHGRVKTAPALEGLKGFDPQIYKLPKDSPIPRISSTKKQTEMGKVTNLIADMSIRGASSSEVARAVRHSMVVIDSEKHELNYKQSYIDNGIAQLKQKYQHREDSKGLGASTLITRAGSETRIAERTPRSAKEGGPVDKVTGKKVFTETGRMTTTKDGKLVIKQDKVDRLSITDNAHKLSSGTPIEAVYADHSNKLKGLADKARLAAVSTKPVPYSPSAKAVYSKQVAELDAALDLAVRNRPLERQAQVIANAVVSAKRQSNPDMEPADRKKIESQALTAARLRTGAAKTRIEISPPQWDAIQAGAIAPSKLSQILNNADLETVKKLAAPKTVLLMTPSKQARAAAMLANGFTQAEVADQLGVSLTTLKTGINTTGEQRGR